LWLCSLQCFGTLFCLFVLLHAALKINSDVILAIVLCFAYHQLATWKCISTMTTSLTKNLAWRLTAQLSIDLLL
jgi:hypothetical protein